MYIYTYLHVYIYIIFLLYIAYYTYICRYTYIYIIQTPGLMYVYREYMNMWNRKCTKTNANVHSQKVTMNCPYIYYIFPLYIYIANLYNRFYVLLCILYDKSSRCLKRSICSGACMQIKDPG